LWEVEGTDEFTDWFVGLKTEEQQRVEATIERLEELGPGLGRPWADSLEGTRVKELRPRGGAIRILFRFDPRRTAILLLGGDKAGQWEEWYADNIPRAEALYEEYLDEIRKEGVVE